MPAPPLTPDERRDRIVFYPVAVVGVFCLTVLMTIAAAFGDPDVPLSILLNQHATSLLLWETGALIVVSVLAMGIDRVRTLKQRNSGGSEAVEKNASPPQGNGHVG